MRVSWTGHRPELFACPGDAEAVVRTESARLRDTYGGDVVIVSGGQRGVDLWAAAAARELGLRLRLYLPAPPERLAETWPPAEAAALAAAVSYAPRTRVFGTDPQDPAGYTARNRALALECDLLIAVWTGRLGGGTGETLAYARQAGKPILEHRLDPSAYPVSPAERGV